MAITAECIYPVYREITNASGPVERLVKKSKDAEWEPVGYEYPIYRDIPSAEGGMKKQIKNSADTDWLDINTTESETEKGEE